MFQVLPGSSANSLVASGAWARTLELITAAVDATQTGSLLRAERHDKGHDWIARARRLPGVVSRDRTASFTLTYAGQVAEMLVFNTTNVPSASSLQAYLSARYALP